MTYLVFETPLLSHNYFILNYKNVNRGAMSPCISYKSMMMQFTVGVTYWTPKLKGKEREGNLPPVIKKWWISFDLFQNFRGKFWVFGCPFKDCNIHKWSNTTFAGERKNINLNRISFSTIKTYIPLSSDNRN